MILIGKEGSRFTRGRQLPAIRRTLGIFGLLMGLCALGSVSEAQASGQPDSRATPPSAPPTESAATGHPELSIADAIQAAIELLNRAEAAQNQEARQALYRPAQEAIEAIKARDDTNVWLFYLYGRLNFIAGRWSDARDLLRKFVETREGRNEWSAYRLLGDLFVQEFPRLAIFQYQRAAELKPNEPLVLHGLAVGHFKLLEFDKARQYAQEAVIADGRRTMRYLSQLVTILAAQKRWAAAETEADAALTLAEAEMRTRPGNLEAVQVAEAQARLLVEIGQGRVKDAPTDAEGYIRLADSMKRRSEIANRIEQHDRLAALEMGIQKAIPNPPAALRLSYALALAEVGRRADAIAQLEELLATDPKNSAAQEAFQRLKSETISEPRP